MKRCTVILILMLVLHTGCATIRRDRCYLAETRYLVMRALFESTGSYQRVAQAMQDEGWSHCEVNTFRYRLRKDLQMDGPDFDALFVEVEPVRSSLDFNPGRVENAAERH